MSSSFFSQAGFLQYEIVLGDPPANLARVKDLFHELAPAKKAVIALPELWAYGFDYENVDEHVRQTPLLLHELQDIAADHDVFLVGSLLEKSNGDIYNTLFFVGSDGVMGKYRKQHLFSLWEEDRHFSRGGFFEPIRTSRGVLGGLICYDLRFPELARNQAFQGANLIVVSAEWPRVRVDHWQSLVRARAIENQVFVVACNSWGNTGEHVLGGNSLVIAPDGTTIIDGGEGEKALAADLEEKALTEIRSRFCSPGESPRPLQDRNKYVELELLLDKLQVLRSQGSRIAFTNGCFDILHSGHVAYLEQARNSADCLVVGLNSDVSVRAIKGADRPVNKELDRARVLAALACVDYVVIFDEETPSNLITSIMPEVLVKGADWDESEIVGAREVKAAGGKVVRIPFEHDTSTSQMIHRIQSNK